MRGSCLLLLACTIACCDASSTTDAVLATTLRMRFDRAASLYDAPWPSDDLLTARGEVRIAFPNDANRIVVRDALAMIADGARGFALAGGVFFFADAPLDPARFPGLAASASAASPVQLFAIDPASPDYLVRRPIDVSVTTAPTAYTPRNVLALLPLQGLPLRPRTAYVALVTRALGDARGVPLAPSAAMRALAAGQRPADLPDHAWATYRRALVAVAAAGIDIDDVAALTAFTTDDPTAALARFRDDALARPRPTPTRAFTRDDVFDDYCVFSSTIALPDYQQGTPSYAAEGGDWRTDAAGSPLLARQSEARLVVTIPRRAAPGGAFPTAVFVRTGGGGDRPLVDRGRQDAAGAALEAGGGPARQFARAGFAGVSVDGPLGGLRNPAGEDEQFTIFNVGNGRALRDNVRQSALELSLLPRVLEELTVDASSCPGAPATAPSTSSRSPSWRTPPARGSRRWRWPVEPRYRAAILSGAGGSWIANILYKQRPLEVAPLIGALLNVPSLAPGDPVLTIVQWAVEPADPQVYARRVLREPAGGAAPRHVLMEQGIVDHYILPRIANATSLSFGLDLAGAPLDAAAGLPPSQLPLEGLLGLAGASRVALPASGNRGGATAVVVQHPADGLQDAHEIVFQRDEPKHEYRCFLESSLRGAPRVPAGTTRDAPCE